MDEHETFVDVFKRKCNIDWLQAVSALPAEGYTVYLVMDEVQIIYKEAPNASPRHKARIFWETVKEIPANLRILMFAAYGSGVVYTQSSTPYHFTDRMLFGIKDLNFTPDEVSEYVTKWFKGVSCFEESTTAMETFCDRLEVLTGGHVVGAELLSRRLTRGFVCWKGGYLDEPKDKKLFDILVSTRAVKVLETLNIEDLESLERMACANFREEAAIVEQCLRNGILAQVGQEVDFSSPVMWRYFVKMRLSGIVRAIYAPKNLPELIARVMRSIDYDSIRQTLGGTLLSKIPLKRSWQIEIFKAVYRCTPSSFVTSADVGALFGSSGFVDFTIDGSGRFWSIELLREANRLAEHIGRFSTGGRYFSIPSDDFCLVDFGRVASVGGVPVERIREDMRDCDKLFVVCYEAELAGVAVFNSAMAVVYRL